MSGVGYHNRGVAISAKICSLLRSLNTSTYGDITPKTEYWIELALTQQLTTVDELAEGVSLLVWNNQSYAAGLARFLKEFRDSPRRSTQAKPFVENVCTRIFQWFVVASAEDLGEDWKDGLVAIGGGYRFMEVTSYIGHLVEHGLFSPELVRLHLIRSLTMHHYSSPNRPAETVRANAICRLFCIAGDVLLRGLLEPEDIRVCFEIVKTQLLKRDKIVGFSDANLEVQCPTHPDASHQNLLT